MKSLFDPEERRAVEARIGRLAPGSAGGWGVMDAAQMLAHCAHAVEAATGDRKFARGLVARVLGPLFRGAIVGEKPFSRESPTHPDLRIRDRRDFAAERARLLAAVEKFCRGGPESAARFEHGFVGRLTGEEWGRLQRKHLDHHLAQFGV